MNEVRDIESLRPELKSKYRDWIPCDKCKKLIPPEIAKANHYKFWYFCCECFEQVYKPSH
jgi:formylmethanofuran dehydrogenase subunit E